MDIIKKQWIKRSSSLNLVTRAILIAFAGLLLVSCGGMSNKYTTSHKKKVKRKCGPSQAALYNATKIR